MGSNVLKKYDEFLRSTNVLSEGTENEFQTFVSHQDKCRKRWNAAEKGNQEAKKYMTKYKADHDTLEVKLRMARHQLDTEIKKRLRAEQTVDHMSRQLELIKELLLDKDTDKQLLIQSLYQHEKAAGEAAYVSGESLHESYSVEESSIDLPESEYDVTEDDILDGTGGDLLDDGGRRRKSNMKKKCSGEDG